jgi:transketolase
MLAEREVNDLNAKSKVLRINLLRMLCEAKSGHSGGSLSAIDMILVLYNKVMRHDPKHPDDPARDRFILSKGHACPALYVVLADCQYFEESKLATLRKFGSILQGHPNMHLTPGLDASTGSLGQGLSISVGMALAAKLDQTNQRVYCLMGDGEQQEGQIWEAAMSAGHYKLDNLCGIIDLNNLQIDGCVSDVMNIEPISDKWTAFNWHVIHVDGHNIPDLVDAYAEAAAFKGKPSVIMAKTVKGKGVSYMENKCGWHGVAPDHEQLDAAICELGL